MRFVNSISQDETMTRMKLKQRSQIFRALCSDFVADLSSNGISDLGMLEY